VLKNQLNVKRNYAYYPILIDESVFGFSRDVIAEKLSKEGIFARKYFYPLVSENKEFKDDLTINTPNAKKYSRNILCLPLYSDLSIEDVDRICDIILK